MAAHNTTFLLTFLIIALGYILKVSGYLNAGHGKALSRIVMNVTLPALILGTISEIDLNFSLVMAPLICILFSLAVSLVASRAFRSLPRTDRGMARMSSTGFNMGLFAYPIIQGLFGSEGLAIVAMMDFGNAFIVFGLSYYLGFIHSDATEGKRPGAGEIFRLFAGSLPFLSYIAAATINLSGLRFRGIPAEILDILARANMGMALLVIGLTFDIRFDISHWKLILKVTGLRYAAGLIAGILLFLFLPYSLPYRTVILFGLVLPAGMAIIPFSVEFGYDTRISSAIVNITIAASFLFMWAFMTFITV